MIIPAIDLIDGKVVRLFQGDYAKQTDFSVDPLTQLQSYQQQGAKWLHIVDLTGAKYPQKRQLSLIKTLTQSLSSNIQVGGGIRNIQQVEDLINIGVKRVVIGSLAVSQPEIVKQCFERFGSERICLALDINIMKDGKKYVATSGWQANSNVTLENLLDTYQAYKVKHCLVTDISCDGTLQGANVNLYKELSQQYPDIQWQASGGIGNLQDIENVKQSGAPCVIVGRALLINEFTVEEAIQCWQNG
ncbi:1-(5-phosphoribosyl)-5-[(5-phosphoribosylamino)methylideneamino]imidazole-4-carboxamide isomerase [Parashewanella curva]|uniref:1-(5-phosphoribosyl)-5-[(5-phosphoribosylamino)methylideneamino] imidazole-4-carboxamide isomerase n=1 Tax=Parashewanella curva TaxID=2338552 RepID=A0A3L8PWG8_9GAMM|nr:1-(5-phosphoribosyl)-5-[(5-phosphoribosylamino)methylideneamino]imidazole-4-carboxamide isomerase [Parashewanella curva]RLV58402.1 1-(5-phosphoribosyl)-5-[(5-phosphoribosylamino)methylideneamino]imidazole-4-carboxamide isomerase [Parashewanella curva]